MTKPKKVNLQSQDVVKEKLKQFKELFPEVFSEGKINFDELKRVLGESVESGKERFGLNWTGKAECMKIIQEPSIATLKPMYSESVDFDTTENLFIEGDNLEVLKLLQKSYFGKVKMIYIDPPYNTGKEFIYPDKYSETLDTYLKYTGQKDTNGNKFSTNTDTDGRYHSRWLNMMYPRLYLAKSLLRDDGVIFISIDDNEQANLKALCNQIFGEENFVCQFNWATKKGAQGMQTKYMVVPNNEYIIAYAKQDSFSFLGEKRTEEGFSNPDNDPRGLWKRQYLQRLGQGLPIRTIKNPENGMNFSFESPYTEEKLKKWIDEKRIIFPDSESKYPARKEFLNEYETKKQLVTSLGLYATKSTTEQLYNLFDGEKVFTNPKPHTLLYYLIETTTNKDDIILDFFAGSGTTGHAALKASAENGEQRRFILVQLPEKTEIDSHAYKAGYKTIADIGKERIRRAARKIEEEQNGKPDSFDSRKLDLGFKVFKLSRSNFKIWESDAEKVKDLQAQLFEHVDHIDAYSASEDILYELLLKKGFPLTTQVKKVTMAKKDVFSIEDGGEKTLICLDKELDQTVINAMAKAHPKLVICLDEGFKGNDQLKTNTVETFKALSREKESEIVFETV